MLWEIIRSTIVSDKFIGIFRSWLNDRFSSLSLRNLLNKCWLISISPNDPSASWFFSKLSSSSSFKSWTLLRSTWSSLLLLKSIFLNDAGRFIGNIVKSFSRKEIFSKFNSPRNAFGAIFELLSRFSASWRSIRFGVFWNESSSMPSILKDFLNASFMTKNMNSGIDVKIEPVLVNS